MRKLLYVSLGLSLLLTIPVLAQEASPQALFQKAIAAQGGEKLLNKFQAGHNRTKGKLHLQGMAIDFTSEEDVQLPDKFRSVVQLDLMNMNVRVTQVFDGKKGWIDLPGNTMEMDEQAIKEIKELLHVTRVANLVGVVNDKNFTLAPLGEAKVKGKDAVGVRVSYKGHRDVNVYFDKKTAYLLKTEGRGMNPNTKQEGNQEKYFFDYHDVQGTKVPRKVEVYNDGNLFVEADVLETQLLEKLDDSTFKRP
jgi:hypothetical protein